MRTYFSGLLLLLLAFAACDDNTSTLGTEVMQEGDKVEVQTAEYEVSTKSILADSLLAKTTVAYLGKYTDPYSNTYFETDFMAQINCLENYEFPEESVIKKEDDGTIQARLIELRLYFSTYYGDSLNVQTVEVYPLTERLSEYETYYTNVDPEEFYDSSSEPLVTKTYSAVDKSVSDSLRGTSDYYPNVRIILPTEYGSKMLQTYYDDPSSFSSADKFIENVCKGFYFKCTQGDGTVLNIEQAHMNLYFDYYIESSSGAIDSLVTGVTQFAASQEVVQVNRFKTEGLEELIADSECTYLQTPAGIFTEVTLPIDDLSMNDTINSAQLILTRYNNFNEGAYQMGVPEYLLMVPKAEVYSFFEEGKVPNNRSYYYTQFSESYNQYDFSNIAYWVNTLRRKKRDNPTTYNQDPDWNKVVLIPVTLTTQTINYTETIVAVRHDLNMNFARLKGNKDKLQLKVIYSRFNDMQ